MKLITLENLKTFKNKLTELFVAKELKTGSDTEYKTLSDNNLTDELVEKINNAGSATAVAESITTAKSEAIAESKEYTDTEVSEALSEAKTYADAAEADAVATAKAYTDTAKTEANTYTDTQVSGAKTELQTAIGTAKTEAISESKTYADEQVTAAKTELQDSIKTQISTVYKIKGSSAFASLPTLSEAEEGNVYNLLDEFTTTADFAEGAGKKYPAGTNIVCIEESTGVFKWDVLMGFIDTDSFVKASDVEVVTESEIEEMFAA